MRDTRNASVTWKRRFAFTFPYAIFSISRSPFIDLTIFVHAFIFSSYAIFSISRSSFNDFRARDSSRKEGVRWKIEKIIIIIVDQFV